MKKQVGTEQLEGSFFGLFVAVIWYLLIASINNLYLWHCKTTAALTGIAVQPNALEEITVFIVYGIATFFLICLEICMADSSFDHMN